MNNVVLQLENVDCPSCSKKIEKALERAYGEKVEPAFDLGTRQMNIDYDPSLTVDEIIKTINGAGYKAHVIED